MKRRICIILALAVGMTAKATVVNTVSSVSDLQAFATSVNAGDNYANETVTLTANLDLNSAAWTPIGTMAHPFKGTFDGQGHTISNIKADGSLSLNLAAGLFGVVGSVGTVKDVHITSGTSFISSNPSNYTCYIGSIAGINYGTIVGCSNSATVTGYSYTNARIGGVVGANESSGSILNCYNLGTVYTSISNFFIGGIAGDNKGTVKNSFMCSIVTTNSSNNAFYPLFGNNSGTVANCFYVNGTTVDVTVPFALAENVDNSSVLSGDNLGSGKNVLLSDRTLYTDGYWNTICLPFDIPAGASGYSPIAGATVMTLSSSSFSAGTLTLNFENATSIEAGKPYIVKWNTPITGNLSNPVFMGVTVSNTTSNIGTTNVDFIGSFSPVALTANDKTKLYLGAENKLYYPNSAMTIKSCRAHFALKGITAGEVAQARLFFSDEEATGIVDAEAYSSKATVRRDSGNLFTLHSSLNVWFTLDGRRLSGKPTRPGIYILNGKKKVIE